MHTIYRHYYNRILYYILTTLNILNIIYIQFTLFQLKLKISSVDNFFPLDGSTRQKCV